MPNARRILTTEYFPKRAAWVANAEMIDPARHSIPGRLWTLLRRAPDHEVVVLNGSGHDEQLAAILLRRLRPAIPLLLTDCTWKLEASSAGRALARLGIRLLDGPRTHYCVLSSAEQRRFPTTWGVDPERVFVTPWYIGLSDEEARAPISEGGSVFSGGDSMRDYRALIEAARAVPFEVRIATRLAPPVSESELPGNVTLGPVPPDEYFRMMCDASVVVVSLAADTERSAGQNNYLNPMALGKLVVVSDTIGVREYVEDRETGLIVPSGDSRALEATLRWAFDPANADEVREIAANGQREVMERFDPDGYVDRLLEIVDQVAPES
jgi:glycosyltransferase involved in cell wall biosynthesis